MHIILVSSRLAGAKSLTLTNRHLIVGLLLTAVLVFSLTLGPPRASAAPPAVHG